MNTTTLLTMLNNSNNNSRLQQRQQRQEQRRLRRAHGHDRRRIGNRNWCLLVLTLLLLQLGAVVDAQPTLAPTAGNGGGGGGDDTSPPTDSAPDVTPPPTVEPTPVPTPAPTGAPSKSPTVVPTPTPTTAEPTAIPTTSPTTAALTDSPTIAPTTAPPTTEPTPMPTPTGTLQPTTIVSDAPSNTPSAAPTALASEAPSMGDSAAPTVSWIPTLSPSAFPSSIPSTDAPSLFPSIPPSDFPSVSPTDMPSLSLQSYLVRVLIWFDNASELKGSAEINFQSATADHIKASIREATSNLLGDLTVGTNIVNQDDQDDGSTVRGRRLQSLGPLGVFFDTRVAFRSEQDNLDVPALVGGAFDTEPDIETYLALLKRTDNTFNTISEVLQVRINDEVLPEPESPAGGSSSLLIIIGASCGGAAILILCALLYVRHRSKHRRRKKYSPSTKATTDAEEGVNRIQTDIYVEPQDEISTLGDPMYAPGAMHMGGGLERDETVTASIVSGDYDYAKAYGTAHVLPSQASSKSNNSDDPHNLIMLGDDSADLPSSTDLGSNLDNSLFSDDSSFEQQFNDMEDRIEVMAPAGKLGMVIDTPSGGVPVVHAIKDTSVLADRVKVGDRLVLVDDEDTTRMTAMQVSKLISVKAEKPARVLVFVRTRARTNSL